MELASITSNHISLASFSHMGPPVCKRNINISLVKNIGKHHGRLDHSSHIFTISVYLCICHVTLQYFSVK